MDIQEILQGLRAIEARLDNALYASIELRADGSGYIEVDSERGTHFEHIEDLPKALAKELQIIEDWLSEDAEE